MQTQQTFERYLTVAEERRLFATVRQYADALARRDAAWMAALRQTGVRVTAFSRLTVFDAQAALRTGYLTLPAAIQKRRQAHRVYLNRKARAAFRDLLRIRREQGHAEHPQAALVMSRNRRSMSVRSFQVRMRLWCARAGLDMQASPHWFRHTLAKRLVAQSTAQDPAGIVQSALGHRARNSTGVYMMPDREAVALALEEAS